jgi:hypothetical protein
MEVSTLATMVSRQRSDKAAMTHGKVFDDGDGTNGFSMTTRTYLGSRLNDMTM